jgi:hypothetical protein
MPGIWTTEKILALAPDPASAKAGKDLSAPRKWKTLGRRPRGSTSSRRPITATRA